ncbi:DUF748 domain-containing protein [Nitrosovibrio sp. Nv6]|uniref:DUF748 domain-containing protein n=1 Tax=Nitrosovibrio sp. Nv6 TaxID=1855340 RepID=UPI0008C51B00|nr:DUF748 domain-containing protein [Nitrosovibrio sp. Nv6]SEP41154.1 Uncharacterized protein involved in outer membrane biogenesis [Nitrosovibrio sp. Nv6]
MSARTLLHRFTRHRRLGIGLGIFVAVIVLFGLLGYFWLPGYAKNKLENALSEALQRPVTVQSIDIQPYTLELTVRGFRIGEKESGIDAGKALFSLDELYTNLSIASVARRAPVISSVSLKAPALRLVREAENRFNITDLIENLMKRPDEADKGDEAMFSVSNIVIEDGQFEFIDRLKESRQKISEIRVGVPFIANFESDEETWVEPHFSAKVNGAPLTLNGKMRPFTENREATLELKLNDVDLTNIDEYSPIPTGISLLSGYFDSDLLLTFTQVAGESPSMVLTGRAALRELEIENEAVEMPYRAKLDQFDVKLTEINLNGSKPSHVALALAEAAVVRKGESEPVLRLPTLNVDEVAIDSKRQSVAIGAVVLDRFKAAARRQADGRLDLLKLVTPAPGTASMPEASAKAETSKPWTAQLGSLKLTGAALRFEDSTLTNIAPMVVDPLDLTVTDIDFSGAAPLKLALKAAINQHGSLETNGSLAWAPLAANFAVSANDVDLVALQGWAGDRLNVLLTQGAASFHGNINADGSPLKVAVNGKGRFTNFNVLDKVSTTDLMRWRNLDINDIKFVNEPLRVDIASIGIADFFARVALSPEGELNLKHIVRQDDNGQTPAQAVPAVPPAEQQTASARPTQTTAADVSQPPTRKRIPVHIGRIVMQGGNVNFNDQFIKPNYRARLTGLVGRVGPLDPGKPGEIDIRGAVDKTAPLKIVGKFDAFGRQLYLDIKAAAKGIDMPAFSPYSGKYVGYAIAKGKLSVDIHYHLEKGVLTAENDIFLDQLTFGEKVESPDALSIPVNLALALLKNRQGEIDVHLPISGSINDPQFSLGGVIVNAIINLLTKAATAPFALLGSAFGGGEELSEISFPPGRAQITLEAEKRLETLSKALADRPALELEITGRADPLHDPEALKHTILERRVKEQKLMEKVKKGEAAGSLDEIELKPEEYEKYLTLVYKEAKFAKPKNLIGLTKSLPVAEMEQLMLANIDASDSQMRELAERRAEAARNWLIEHGDVSSDRMFMLAPKIETEADGTKSGSGVEFSLR